MRFPAIQERVVKMQMANLKNLFAEWALLLVIVCAVSGETIYVNDDAGGANNGTSWTDAYTSLRSALIAAGSGDQIWVAAGTYKPGNSRSDSFQMKNGVAIYGGFVGNEDPNSFGLADRDFVSNETILSGDLAGNDVDVNDPTDLLDDPSRGENSYHVVFGSDTDESAVLDGFTITGGNANSFEADGSGAGMYNDYGNPTVTNCTFKRNLAKDGGGMYNYNASPIVTNCTFSGNLAGTACVDAGSGGGMSNLSNSSPTLTNCIFSGNSAFFSGGGMCNSGSSSPVLLNCMFSRNSAGLYRYYCPGIGVFYVGGGGMRNSWSSNPTLINCIFSGNRARNGGAMYNFMMSNSTLKNCTFAKNWANTGNALVCDSYWHEYPSINQLINCILWDGGNEIWNYDNSVITIIYSDVQGGWPGESNIDADPCFADANSGDYHLKSRAGRWEVNSESWIQDDVNSLCIDAGDPNSDWTAELWPHGKRINMGAYGGTPQASMSLSDEGNIADLNTDGWVGYRDILLFTGKWLYDVVLLAEDLNRDGIVTFIDFAIFAPNWQPTPPGPAKNPNPANGARNIDIDADLSWTACARATSHDVYFGTSNSPPFVCSQTATTFDPGTMAEHTTYYWRIDEVGDYGTTTGTSWRFTTEWGGPPP
jgi:hypothetical protein